jgi:hypothetical protein
MQGPLEAKEDPIHKSCSETDYTVNGIKINGIIV